MITVRNNIDIKEMTTFGLPALCSRLIEFSDPADLPHLDREGMLAGALVVGGGSNLLFTAPAPELTVIHPTANGITIEEHADGVAEVHAQAAVVLDRLTALLAAEGLWGTENLSGIPGCIGGAAVQNVGAYGTEFKDVVKTVECYSLKKHTFITLTNSDCCYGYRDSVFKHLPADEKLIVTAVTLTLSRYPNANLTYKGLFNAIKNILGDALKDANQTEAAGLSPETVRETVIALRDKKLPSPSVTGSAGSFFKNPVVTAEEYEALSRRLSATEAEIPGHKQPDGSVKLSAAWLIDHAGCKPLTCGGAALWQKQPLVLVNADGNATGADVVALEQAVIDRVRNFSGITLIPEVIHI